MYMIKLLSVDDYLKKKFDLPVDNVNFYYCAEFSKQKENDSYKTLNDNF